MFNKNKKKFIFKFPSVFTIILGIMMIIVIITWIPGVVMKPFSMVIDNKKIDYNPHVLGILDVLHATIQGIIKRADIIAFVFSIGAYVSLILKSEALEAGMGVLIKKLKGKEILIIPICILFFSLGGTIYNMAEETIAYYPILIPVLMFAGFDVITTIMVITFGAGMGVIGSTIAPFSIIIASGTLNISPMNGIIWRIIIYLLSLIATIWITMFYANKVKKNPSKSILFYKNEKYKKEFGYLKELPIFTKKRKIICIIFAITFILMVLLELPWNTFLNINDNTWYGDDNKSGLISNILIKKFPYIGTSIFSNLEGGLFIDLSVLFFAMTFIIGFLDWKGEENHIKTIINGINDLLGVALIISTAGGVAILLDNNHSALSLKIAKEISLNIGHMNSSLFIIVCYLIFIIISFFIPSTSGFAIAILPLFKNAAIQSNCISGMITAFVSAEGFMNLITPAGLPMACLMIAKVNYKEFILGCWPLILAAFLIPLFMLPLGALFSDIGGGTIFF